MKNTIPVNGKRMTCRIYDNGKSGDRFTACFRARTLKMRDFKVLYYPYLGFGSAPFHPQGIAQHGESDTKIDGKHLGKRIAFESLNEDCQKLILQEFA